MVCTLSTDRGDDHMSKSSYLRLTMRIRGDDSSARLLYVHPHVIDTVYEDSSGRAVVCLINSRSGGSKEWHVYETVPAVMLALEELEAQDKFPLVS